MSKFIFSVVFGTFIIGALSVPFKICGGDIDVLTFDIAGCVEEESCVIKLGDNFTMTVVFASDKDISFSNLQNKVYLKFLGSNTEIKVTPDDPCKQLVCPPTEKNVTYTATSSIPITMPALPYSLVFEFKSPKDQILCVRAELETYNGDRS